MLSPSAASCTPSSSNSRIPFAQVTRPFISDPRINLREFRVYSALLTFPPNEAGERWPSRATLGTMTGLPPKVVSRTTSRLQDLGWLAKTGDGGRSNTARYVVFDQPQSPAVIHSIHLAAARPTAQDIHPQNESGKTGNPPQNDPGYPPKGGRNEEGQEVDYLDAVDRESQPAAHEADQTPAYAAHSESASHVEDKPQQPQPAPQQRKVTPRPAHTPQVTKEPPPATAPDAWLEQAALMRPDLTADQIRASSEIFLDNARSKGNLLADWQPAFRNWIRRERAPRATQNAPQTTNTPSRYAHLDMPEKPVSAAVRAAIDAGEANRIAMLIRNGIDPVTGTRIAAPIPSATGTLPDGEPLPPGRNESPEDYDRRFEQHRQFQLARSGIDPTTGVKITMPTTPAPKPTSKVKPVFTPATPKQISAEKLRRIAELAANGMTLADAKAALEKGNLSDDSLEGVSGGFPPGSQPLH